VGVVVVDVEEEQCMYLCVVRDERGGESVQICVCSVYGSLEIWRIEDGGWRVEMWRYISPMEVTPA
jgi:hypothetical protein